MSGNFHEELRHEDVTPPSERATGIVFVFVTAIFAALWRDNLAVAVPFAGLSVALGVMSWRCPRLLGPLNILWFRFGLLLHKIVNPVVMMALFAIAIVPAGLIMQRLRDPLVKKRKPAGESYWADLTAESRPASSMTQQF